MQHVREKDAIHRDLKPQNLLLKRGPNNEIILKIADFGFAREVEAGASMTTTLAGTPLYMVRERTGLEAVRWASNSRHSRSHLHQAPEILRGTVYRNMLQYSVSSDLWSVGVIFFEMLFGYVPYSHVCGRARAIKWQRHSLNHSPCPSSFTSTGRKTRA